MLIFCLLPGLPLHCMKMGFHQLELLRKNLMIMASDHGLMHIHGDPLSCHLQVLIDLVLSLIHPSGAMYGTVEFRCFQHRKLKMRNLCAMIFIQSVVGHFGGLGLFEFLVVLDY